MSTTAISYLFVPASRPDRYEKALASAADAVIVDLEDAVPNDEKTEALEHLVSALEAGLPKPVLVRINAADSGWYERDIAALEELSGRGRISLSGVLLPKAESPEPLARIASIIGTEAELIAIIETAQGISHLREIGSVRGLTRFALGAADLSFDIDAAIDSATLDWVYARLVIESRAIGLAGPIASPPFEIRDLSKIAGQAARLRSLGATAQLCIHPTQIDPIHRGFLPNTESVEWARRVVAATESGDGAMQLEGQMIDKPVRERAERLIAQALRRTSP